jgi:hypothetical protein
MFKKKKKSRENLPPASSRGKMAILENLRDLFLASLQLWATVRRVVELCFLPLVGHCMSYATLLMTSLKSFISKTSIKVEAGISLPSERKDILQNKSLF